MMWPIAAAKNSLQYLPNQHAYPLSKNKDFRLWSLDAFYSYELHYICIRI